MRTRQAIFAGLVLWIASCSESPPEPLRIVSSPWPGYEPLYLARDLGYFGNNRVNLFELPSADINMESFRNGSIDLATLTLDEAIELLRDGIKLRILLVMDFSNGADAVLANLKSRHLRISKVRPLPSRIFRWVSTCSRDCSMPVN